ncbi:glycosyltransferase, partial [bacterium]|nr:glycosyltransferase [bacterium]
SKVICISNRQLNYLDSNLNISRKKLFIDRPIVPNSFYSNLEYKINKFNTQKIEVVFIGRLDKGKGIDDVISIMNKLIQDSRFSCKIYGIYFPDDEYGKKIHNYLENQKVIKYTAISRESYSVQIEDKTASIFKSCDIFLQPYRNISSTVDAPLLIYEAMAALTVIISRNVGELSNIIGSDKFLFDNKDNDSFVKSSIESIKKITVNIYSEELKRLDKRNCELNINKDDIWIV